MVNTVGLRKASILAALEKAAGVEFERRRPPGKTAGAFEFYIVLDKPEGGQ